MDSRSYDYYNFIKDKTTGINMDKFSNLNESAQLGITDTVLDKVFDAMMAKYTKVDFGDIPNSKGNIQHFKYFDNMSKCIDMLVNIAASSSEEFNEPQTLQQARENLIKLAPLFEKGFHSKNSYIVILYNTMLMALFQGTSAVISAMIDFINNGESMSVCINKYKNSSQMMLVQSLVQFNAGVADGTISKYMSEALNKKTINESITLGAGLFMAGTAIWLGTKIIPLIKQLIYLFYHTSNRIADSARIQAEFLETNIEILKSQNIEENEKIISKQQKIAEFFKGIARKFAVNNDRSEHEVSSDLKREPVTDINDIVV